MEGRRGLAGAAHRGRRAGRGLLGHSEGRGPALERPTSLPSGDVFRREIAVGIRGNAKH